MFSKVITNTGNGYNPNNGVFTAPVRGKYVFFVNVQCLDKQSIYVDIVLNDRTVLRTMAYSNYDAGPNLAVLSLRQEDRCGSDMPRAGATLTTPQGHSPHFLVFFYDFIAIFGCWMCRKKRGWGSNWEGRGLNWVHRRWPAIVWDIHVLSSLYIPHPQWYRIKPDRYTSGLWRDFDIVGQKTGLLVWKIFTRVC